MKKIKSFAIVFLSFVCTLAIAASTVGFMQPKTVSAQDKDLSYSVLFFNEAGTNKAGLVANDGQWPSLKAKNATHLVQFATNAANEPRYATLVFSEAIDASVYSGIELKYNYVDISSSDLSAYPQSASVYKPVTTEGTVSGTARSEEAVATIPAFWYQDSSNGNKAEMDVEIGKAVISTDLLKEEDGKVYGVTLHLNGVGATTHLVLFGATAVQAEPQTETLDFDLTQAWFEYKGEKVTTQETDAYAKLFGGDGSTKITFKNLGNDSVTVRLGKSFNAEDYGTVEIRLAVSNWTEGNGTVTMTGYALTDTGFENPLGEITTEWGNKADTLVMDAAKLADADGKITGFVLVKTNALETASGQIFADYVRIVVKEKTPAVSLYYQAGDLVEGVAQNPRGIVDENVTWTSLVNHGKAYEPYGYVEHPAFKTYNATNFPAFEMIDSDGTANDVLMGKNIVQTIALGNVWAEDYARLEITYFFTDWLYGSHTIYVYGDKTTAFTDAEGNPVGYVAKATVQGPSTKFTFKIDDTSLLAGSNGKIQYIYLMYGSEVDGKGFWNGTQFWVNEVNLYIPEDMPNPVVSEEYTEKDISELLPVGAEGVNFNLTSNGITSGEGFGAYTQKISLKTTAVDVIDFSFTPTYAEDGNFSFYFLLKAKADSVYSTGGFVFWFSDSNILFGNGVKNDYVKILKSQYPEGTFVSGTTTKIRLAVIPYYLEGAREGYYLAIYVNGEEKPMMEGYFAEAEAELGEYTKIVMQDLGKDYGVKIASSSETPVSAEEIMNVTVSTTSGKTTFDKPRAGIVTTHFEMDGEVVSELKIEGDAVYNAETKTLNFNSEGTVKVSFTVTNEFGEFTSNVLELTYDDGVEEPESVAQTSGCTSSFGGIGVAGAFLFSLAGIVSVRRRKEN